ncbi:MAG: hypothetical protein ACLQVY_06955 [Limisphaerales bacterium]
MAALPGLRPGAAEPPLRGELFSAEQLARHAKALAAQHQVSSQPGFNRLLARLSQNEDILRDFNRATLAVSAGRHITPASEWLLDNFYLIEEQIHMARRHLPRGYSRELPRLSNGPSAGLPRVYDIVFELTSHVDAQIEPGLLQAFVAAYQTVASLKLGELWAIPIMLRLGLIENLQRIATRLTNGREDRDLADVWVDRLQEMAERNPAYLVVVVADMAKSGLPFSSSFVAEFCQRLSRQSPVLHLARGWLEQWLVEQGRSIEQLVHLESQNQAADQVSVSHTIGSLRLLSALDWKGFVEDLSLVDQKLRQDPAGVYTEMDFSTRDRYRHEIEATARYGQLAEAEVAQRAVRLAAEAARQKGPKDRTGHVGFYLIDKGQSALARLANARWPWHAVCERTVRRFALPYYMGGIWLLTLLATFGFAEYALNLAVSEWRLFCLSAVFLVSASQLAVALMNWFTILQIKPRPLPRLDYSAGIAAESRTLAVVPTMLSSPAAIDRLIDTLEIHYLANRDTNLHFGLLTDFRDAAKEVMPQDPALVQRVRAGVQMLNRKYPSDGHSVFFLFHRPRRWNPSEGRWMGYERKRGKLMELNELLRGRGRNAFSEIVGDTSLLSSVKYVITLDTDTQLPREAARQLVGTMAHPLNRPVFDPVRGIVSEGYAILQPRVGTSLPGARRSWFVRLFGGDAGIDPYTRAVSDVYQDLFKEGSFIGKGIYDVDAFQRAMDGRFPENTVLSHDLLESCHGRSGLVSDVELFEEYPSRYDVDIDRRHRWIRGDWQISPWLLARVPVSDAPRIANPLSVLSQWKIFDNLRRSLVPVALLFFLLGSWLLLPALAGAASLLALAIISIPGLLSALVDLSRKPADLPWPMHLQGVAASVGRQLGQVLVNLTFLPNDAYVSLDAIGRTLVRVLATRKRLLEWRPSSDSEGKTDLLGFYKTMWIAPLWALATAAFMATTHPGPLLAALPLLSLWLVAPWIAWRISQPIEAPKPGLTADQLTFLRQLARKTWYFFENFVTAQENWLPPG